MATEIGLIEERYMEFNHFKMSLFIWISIDGGEWSLMEDDRKGIAIH